MPYVTRDASGTITEWFANEQFAGQEFVAGAMPAVPPAPNAQGFQDALKAAAGGIVAANALSTAYPLLVPAIQQQVWPDVQALILDAYAKGILNATQYAAFQAAATANNIPVALP